MEYDSWQGCYESGKTGTLSSRDAFGHSNFGSDIGHIYFYELINLTFKWLRLKSKIQKCKVNLSRGLQEKRTEISLCVTSICCGTVFLFPITSKFSAKLIYLSEMFNIL